jgi:hypothetical protein
MPVTAPSMRQDVQEIPLPIVGGTKFGRYNKISSESTWNFIVSDNWLVPYAGYKNQLTLDPTLVGRGLYSSFNGNFMIAVIGPNVYKITTNPSGGLVKLSIGVLATDVGDVYMAENNNGEIAITDNVYVYVYNYLTSAQIVQLNSTQFPFSNPGYISFQNGRLIIAITSSTNWVLSGFNNAMAWSKAAAFVGSLQTKPDKCQAVVPIPGGGNNILVFGRNVIEQWQDVGNAKFPYQRASTSNIDFGCINPTTIAYLDNYVVWLGVNELSGPVLMVSSGGEPQAISTDGIDYQMGNLTDPTNCTGFLYKQDGHTIYQFTFLTDNLSYAYDFKTQMFFNVSDENLDYHIAREVVYYNNTYYFVSLNGGNVYEFDSSFTAAQYSSTDIRIIPRIRICPPLRMPDQEMYIARSLSFTIENGQPNIITQTIIDTEETGFTIATESGNLIATEDGTGIDTEGDDATPVIIQQSANVISLAVSRDGGQTYGTFWPQDMYATGQFRNRLNFQRVGQANDMTYQLRFNGPGRFLATNGVVEVYK